MSEVGKAAKRMGVEHPSVTRRTEPVPEKATPKKRRSRARARFGYTYKYLNTFFNWGIQSNWYLTASHRDQAWDEDQKRLKNRSGRHASVLHYELLEKVER